jgi:hypothetical protein
MITSSKCSFSPSQLSFRLITSQPINDVISTATAHLNIDTEDWTLATTRGIWTRTASEWNTRAKAAGIEWGTKQGIQARSSEVTARIRTISGDAYSCRPLEHIDSSPCPLPIVPHQVFILTSASAIMATTNGKIEGYVHRPLSLKLKLSERLVRACISSSFQRTASVFSVTNRIQIHQFLVPPVSLLSLVPFDIHRSRYGKVWPDQSSRIIQDCQQLQSILNDGNNQADTLVLLAHQAYNHMGWVQWAGQMSRMSENSSFGIGYVCVTIFAPYIPAHPYPSADRDVVFERDRTLFGRDALDYIIAIPNRSLQILSAFLSTHTSPKYICSFILELLNFDTL